MKAHVFAYNTQLNKRGFMDWMRQVTVLLSFVVVLGVFWSLKLTGITMAGEAFCGMQEHRHGESCLSPELVCPLEESPGHMHSESCILRHLVCALEEVQPHVHDEDCIYRELICTQPELEGHTHTDACRELLLVCPEEEREGHAHGEDCFTMALICTVNDDPEHIHAEQCWERTLLCGLPEEAGHQHGETCWPAGETLLCGMEEIPGHAHGEDCWAVREGYLCGLEQTEGHAHEESCYIIGIGFGCGLTEGEGHVHTVQCLTEQTELGCGLPIQEPHGHTDACYVVPEQCTLQEHIHTESCYSDITADLETETDRKNSLGQILEELTTAQRLVAVARSQLGYTESTLNFEVDLQGIRRGITRYGQWYGNPYGDWSAMFAAFCLHYADVEDLPANAGPESMRLEWVEAGLYAPADSAEPRPGDLIFLTTGLTEVGIICDVTDTAITLIQGDFEDTVRERSIERHDPAVLGYGRVPERSPYAVQLPPPGDMTRVAQAIAYSDDVFREGRSFLLYVRRDSGFYAIDGTAAAVPVTLNEGWIYADTDDPETLLWTFTPGEDGYVIRNVGTGLYLHPYYNSSSDYGIVNQNGEDTSVAAAGTGMKFIQGAQLDPSEGTFRFAASQSEEPVFYLAAAETCTVWLDGTNGGLSSSGGSQNQSYTVERYSQMTLPTEWYSPTKYSYKLRGWYDVTHDEYYAPGETVYITESTVFYADWMAATYDIGKYNAYVADTVSTNSFITTRMFDYNYLFNVLSADSTGSISASSHSENWSIVRNENVDYEDRETLNFIFLDYGGGGTLDYPGNRQSGVNEYPGSGIVTGGIYNSAIGDALFSTDDHVPGKQYLGTADHLFQIMTDPSDPYYGYYYYDSSKNAASYNQSAGRFYVYDYLEVTTDALSATRSDFLPLNSPYANTNGQELGTYQPEGMPTDLTHYVYDAKYSGSGSSVDRVSANYAFGMKSEIRFYLPNKPGTEDGNQDLYGNDMRFVFSGDDDLWILVDGKLALDIGGIHGAETGEINFTTGDVLIQGTRNSTLSNVVTGLEPGEHTLTLMYLERGASQSNCAIYFNLAPRFHLDIQKEDVLTREVLNGAQFSVFLDLDCTEPAELWASQQSYLNGDPATNVFTVQNGSAHMWGMGAGNTYYIKETRAPDNSDYGFPNGIIRMVLDKRGAATYSVVILDAGDGISGGFTVHGFRVDDENQHAYIIATNAPKWVQDVTSVEVRKTWADGKDHSGDAVTVYLTIHDPDGTVRRLQEGVLSEETDWHHLWENLPKYYEDGTPIEYGVEEGYVPGYYSQAEQTDSYTTSVSTWTEVSSLEDGKTYLLKTSSGFLSTLNRNSDTGYMWVDEATAKSSDMAQWKVTKSGSNYRLTNLAGQSITFYYNNGSPTDFYASTGGESSAAKQYFAYSVSGSQIQIYYDAPNNRNYYIRSTMNSSKKFNYSTSSRNGMLFTLLTETKTTTDTPVEGDAAYRITNTPLEQETSVTVSKVWSNHLGDDPSLYEEARVTVKLLANGRDTGRTITLSLKNGWTDAFRGLPYKDSSGNVIAYTIEESWNTNDWLAEYGPIEVTGGSTPSYSTTLTNVYRWGRGVELPSTGSPARMLYILCGSAILLFSLVYGFVSRRKRERRME